MPTQTNLESPTFRELPTADAAGDYEFGARTLRGIDIWADGDVKITDVSNNTKTRTFIGITGSLPFRWVIQVQKLFGTGNGTTDVTTLDCLN